MFGLNEEKVSFSPNKSSKNVIPYLIFKFKPKLSLILNSIPATGATLKCPFDYPSPPALAAASIVPKWTQIYGLKLPSKT